MVLLRKKFLLVGALVIGGLFFSSCSEDDPAPTPAPEMVTIKFSEKKGDIAIGAPVKITESSKDKQIEIYYEVVASGETSKLTKDNYKDFTKYTGAITAPDGTIYAIAVKNNVVVSEITSITYKLKDYVSYVLPKGADGDVRAWTKSTDGVQNLPDLKLHGESSNITDELKAALTEKKNDPNFFKKPKNFILMMGDGMGVSQVVAATKHRGPLLMNDLPYKAVANSWVRGNTTKTGEVTDSAAGGSKLATGYRTTKLFAGIDAEGNELMNLSELARSKGKKVGIVTNAELADATPAAFTVHNKNRSQGWTKICQQEVLFGADLFMGGTDGSLNESISGLKSYLPKNIKMSTTLSEIITNFETEDLMWNLFGGGDTTLGRWNASSKNNPSMQQQMALSLARLQKTSGDEGFFLMFENTYTDIYGHWNDSFASQTNEMKNKAVDADVRNISGIINEVKDFDECLAVALKFVLENPDTVLLVTADHETGNMQFKSGWEDNIYKLSAKSGSHSNQHVPIFAIGYGMDKIDTKKGELFKVEDCESTDASLVVDNTICGQVFGDLINDVENSFGGDINTDTRGRSRDTFTVTTTAAASSVTFNMNVAKLPISSSEYIQFKIKPYAGASTITVKNSSGTAVCDKLKFADCASAAVAEATPLAPAHKHAFVASSDVMDGWYQISCKAGASSKYITVELTGDAVAGATVEIDDFTVQYASTKGYVTITGDNVTAVTNKIGY